MKSAQKFEGFSALPSEQEFRLFRSLVHKKLGICLPDQKRAMLGHRLINRINDLGLNSFSEYYQYVNHVSHEDEMREMLERITTNETFFFREKKHFEFMSETLLPNIEIDGALRVWSAACSTGEEPYSIAMTLMHTYFKPWEVLASDVNESVIEHARKGIYLDERTSLIPEPYRRRFCRKGKDEFDGYMRIIPEIRTAVAFKAFNLLDDMSVLGKFHVIFLRNVLIYFDTPEKSLILSGIAKALHPKGWLFTGHSESLYGVSDEFEMVQPAVMRLKSSSQDIRHG